MSKLFWSLVWTLSESLNIPLGSKAPYVFGKMIGASSWSKVEEDES